MKQFLACIFLTIFSFQVLPVKELGKLLFKSAMTEEVHQEAAADMPDFKVKKEGDPFAVFIEHSYVHSEEIFTSQVAAVIHRSDGLPDYHVPEILTPPPNSQA